MFEANKCSTFQIRLHTKKQLDSLKNGRKHTGNKALRLPWSAKGFILKAKGSLLTPEFLLMEPRQTAFIETSQKVEKEIILTCVSWTKTALANVNVLACLFPEEKRKINEPASSVWTCERKQLSQGFRAEGSVKVFNLSINQIFTCTQWHWEAHKLTYLLLCSCSNQKYFTRFVFLSTQAVHSRN